MSSCHVAQGGGGRSWVLTRTVLGAEMLPEEDAGEEWTLRLSGRLQVWEVVAKWN